MASPGQITEPSSPAVETTSAGRTFARLVALAWLAWLAEVLWNGWIVRRAVLHPSYVPTVICLAAQVAAAAALIVLGVRSWRRGGRRGSAAAAMLLGTAPLWFWGGIVRYCLWRFDERHFPRTFGLVQGAGLGATLGDLELRLRYPRREEGQRVVMFHRDHPRPAEAVAAADQHLARLERLLPRPPRGKVHWVRGPLWGRSGYYFLGLAMSPVADESAAETDVLSTVDRHELAHFALENLCNGDHHPPFVLVEGWAESQCGYEPGHLARAAMRAREQGDKLSLGELTGGDWYSRDIGPVYTHGGPLVDYLLRTYGGEKFFELYNSCRPATFAADVERVLGVSVGELEAAYRSDIERQISPWPQRLAQALERLPCRPEVDEALWRLLIREHTATVARLSAPPRDGVYDVTLDHRDEQSQPPVVSQEHQQVVRDGRRELYLHDQPDSAADVIVASPDGSFRLIRGRAEQQWQRRNWEYFEALEGIDGHGWSWMASPTFADDPLDEFEKKFQVAAVRRSTEGAQPTVEVELEAREPKASDESRATYGFLPDRGWIMSTAIRSSIGNDGQPLRTVSRYAYDFLADENPVYSGSTQETSDAATGKRLWTWRTRITRRACDEATLARFELAHYAGASPTILDRLPAPPSVLVTWAGFVLSLVVGTSLQIARRLRRSR